MFQKRLRGVHAGIRHWSGLGLSYMGRVHVVNTVLAAALYQPATFIHPPADSMRGITAAIDHFVAQGGFGCMVLHVVRDSHL
jgi:hypothetical protein